MSLNSTMLDTRVTPMQATMGLCWPIFLPILLSLSELFVDIVEPLGPVANTAATTAGRPSLCILVPGLDLTFAALVGHLC